MGNYNICIQSCMLMENIQADRAHEVGYVSDMRVIEL